MQRLPPWLRQKFPDSKNYSRVRNIIQKGCLHTICEEASCPNRGECWDSGTATFLLLGDTCTRNCSYCNVKHGQPQAPDPGEPERIASAVAELGLKYAVLTSVTRDDLDDGGASHFARTIQAIRERMPETDIEVLIPDFIDHLDSVTQAKPTVLNHNIEVAAKLFATVRPQGDYQRSLALLRKAKEGGMVTKSGFMLGLGETDEDIMQTLRDLRENGVDIVTIGQYLRPSASHPEVARYYTPEEFEAIGKAATGFLHVDCAPFVRSSYDAKRKF